MFSRSGATTITLHRVFHSQFKNIDELEGDIRNQRKHKGFAHGAASSGGGIEVDERMPKFDLDANGQQIVELPGLAQELHNLESHYKK